MRALLALAVFAVAVPDREDPFIPKTQPMQQQLQGEWAMTASVINGRPQDPKSLEGRIYTFNGNEMLIRMPKNDKAFAYAITVDAAKQPPTIDIVSKTSKKAIVIQGIFKIEGDTLTICYHRGVGAERPTDFVAAPNTQAVLWQFKRAQTAPDR